jgi:hypothetical protein
MFLLVSTKRSDCQETAMDFRMKVSGKMPWQLVLLTVLMVGSALGVQGQEKKSNSPSKPAPAPKPAAPHAGPSSQQHPGTPGQQNGPGANAHGPNAHGPNATGPNGKGGPNAKGPSANTPNTKGGPNAKGPNANGPNAKGGPNNAKGNAPNGRGPHTPPGKTVALKNGGKADLRPNGKVRAIDAKGMHIEHGLHGGRRIEGVHNGARVVNVGRHGGYVQRPYVVRNGRTYVQRTYVVNHVTYTGVYRSYGYGGYCCYYGYAPAYYYRPAYYGWAYNPWPAPAPYAWGWGGAPWYGYYGGYFAPYPVYPSAAFWLTDYLVAANLQAAYQAQAEAAAAGGQAMNDAHAAGTNGGGATQAAGSNAVAMTPEVKQAIAEEVKAQLAAEKDEAAKAGSSGGQKSAGGGNTASSNEVPPALDPARRTFVVFNDLDVTTDSGEECELSAGDVITRLTDTPDDDKKVNVSVASSKKTDCAAGKQVAVKVDDLQEMHNHFREQLTSGMKSLAEKQGTGGLPKAPDTSTTGGEVPAPPPDTTAAKALQDQEQSADQTETEVTQETSGGGGGR